MGLLDGDHLLQGADGGQIGQMDPGILFAVGSGQQPFFDIIVHHGGGENLGFTQVNELPRHIGQHLIHIQPQVRKAVPVHRAFLPQPLLQFLQFLQFVHVSLRSFLSGGISLILYYIKHNSVLQIEFFIKSMGRASGPIAGCDFEKVLWRGEISRL